MSHVEPTPPPAPPRSMVGNLLSVIGLVLAGIYLANPGWGIVELIPDNFAGIGNIDEVAATTIFLACLSRLGINILPQGLPRKTTVVQSHVVKD
jgi:uncharacterized membrane protein YkvA (DUF1232 family)